MSNDAPLLKRAAYWLEDSAQVDHNGYTVRGKWCKDRESIAFKKEHDEKRMLAKRLRAMARILSGSK